MVRGTGFEFRPASYWLCELGKIFKLSVPQFPQL